MEIEVWNFKKVRTCTENPARRAPGGGGGKRERAFRWARFFLFVGLGGCGFGCLGRRGKVNKIKVGQTEADACYHTSWTKGSVNVRPVLTVPVTYWASRLRGPL